MSTITATEARASLYKLIDQASDNHQPITITGKRNNAVLVSEEDWKAIAETLYLTSIPGMSHSIQDGLAQPLAGCNTELTW